MRWSQGGFNRMRSRAAFRVAAATGYDFDAFVGRRYCLVVSYRRDGSSVPTPVWCATDGERIVFRSLVDNGKTKRIRNNPTVLVAPCDARGRPLGEVVSGAARLLSSDEEPDAERLLLTNHGLGRRVYNWLAAAKVPGVYIEVTADVAESSLSR